jgi:hypothetical protein
MSLQKKCIVIKFLLCLSVLPCCLIARADSVAGKLVQTSSAVLVKQADGKIKVIDQNASIAQGDTLVTDSKTYAQIQFADSSEITLAPKTTVIVEHFTYDKNDADKDRVVFNFVRGGLHYVPGQIAQRNKNKVVLKTLLGNIDGATANFVLQYTQPGETVTAQVAPVYPVLALNGVNDDIQSDALPDYGISRVFLAQNTPAVPALGGNNTLAPGLYVHVIDGIINLSNQGGSQSFTAGQFGYTASFIKPPVVLPTNPGIQFTPPPAFSAPASTQGSTQSNKSNTVDCEVR